MSKYRFCTIAPLLPALPFSLSLFAADSILSPGDTDVIRDRQERLLQEQQRRLDELQQLPCDAKLAAPELADESRCFDCNLLSTNTA